MLKNCQKSLTEGTGFHEHKGRWRFIFFFQSFQRPIHRTSSVSISPIIPSKSNWNKLNQSRFLLWYVMQSIHPIHPTDTTYKISGHTANLPNGSNFNPPNLQINPPDPIKFQATLQAMLHRTGLHEVRRLSRVSWQMIRNPMIRRNHFKDCKCSNDKKKPFTRLPMYNK